MMVGPPLDFINTEDLAIALYDICKLLLWEKDLAHKERVLIKIRDTELDEIPKSLRYTIGDALNSESWTCSVEVLQEDLLGDLPADVDPVPDDGIDHYPLSDEDAQVQQFLPLLLLTRMKLTTMSMMKRTWTLVYGDTGLCLQEMITRKWMWVSIVEL
jgi:hypothetical protein